MATYIDGIGASENIDSSGERISIAGMDISSLAVDGVFNWEHNKDQPNQVVGKVLRAKKIFSEKDCEDERQLYFWNKCTTPFVYVMGELFDDYKESAKDVAGMFRYDSDKRGQNERNVMNFSIEGAKINKVGIDIVRSIARKVTITVLPCNKAAVAEMVPNEAAKPKDDIDSLFKSEFIFKSENFVEIELLKSEDIGKFLSDMKKSKPAANPLGTHMGTTSSGKDIHSHQKIHAYQGFGSQDHREAANKHYTAIQGSTDPKMNQHHMGKMKLHMQAASSAEKREKRGAVGIAQARAFAASTRPSAPQKSVSMKKTLTMGSGNAAPGNLTGGAALAKQCVDPKMHKGCTHEVSMKKSEMYLKRAEAEYANWDKKERFREFMSGRMPKMTKTEIDVFGATMLLKKSMETEKAFENITKALKFGSEADQAATAKFVAEQAKKPKAPKKEHKPEPELKGHVKTEVSHVESHLSDKVDHETVHLKSGHKVMGVKKGTHKVGDKVTVSAHPMGARVLTPGHD